MRKEYITLFLVLILAFSFIAFIIPQRVNAITQFNLNTNYAYGLPNPYQAVLLNNYLTIGYLKNSTQLNLFVYNNRTGSNTTVVVKNFPYPLNNYYLFPFNNSKILIVTFFTYTYFYISGCQGSPSNGYLWLGTTNTFITPNCYLYYTYLNVTTNLYTPSTNTFSSPQRAQITTFQWASTDSNKPITSGLPNCNYVGSNTYSLSSINPRVFVCSTPMILKGQLKFWLIVLNYNFISYAQIATVTYTSNKGQEIFYSIVDTYSLLSGSSASGWIDNNSTNIAFTATFSPSTNALSIASSSTSINQPFPFLKQVYSQSSNLYGMLGNINSTTGGGLNYIWYVENWYNTPQYVPNNGYLYPTVGTINPTYIKYYYMITSSGNPGAVQSFTEGFSSNITFSDVGGTFYYPSAFQIITTLVYYIGSTSTSDIELDAFNNATTAQYLSSRLPTQLSGIFLTGVLQYFGNVLIYWSGSTSKLYVQLVSGYLNSLSSISHGGGGGGISNTPPPPTPTSNFTLSFTPSVINMFLATIFIFIPAIILIPFLGIAGFIAGAALGTIFAIIAGFIPYWALVVIVLLIIALILRGRSFSKEE